MQIISKARRELIRNWRGYLLAAVLVAIATWLKNLAQPNIIPANVPILYITAIVPTAIFFGLGPSILVCILSLLAFDFFFVAPLHQLNLFSIENGAFLAIFLLVGVMISYLASNLRRKNQLAAREVASRKQSETDLIKYRDHLEELVKQRTAELEQANLTLKEDIAERTQAQAERQQLLNSVQQEKDRVSAIVNSIADEVWFFDVQGKISLLNPAAASEFGFETKNWQTVEDLVTTLEVYNPDGSRRSREQNPALRAMNGETIKNQAEAVRIPASQEMRYRQVSAAPVMKAGGQLIGAVCVVRDITEIKQMEEALRQHEAELTTLLDSIPAGLVLFEGSPPYKVMVHNRYYQQLFAEPFFSRGMAGLNVYDYAPEVEASGVVAVFDEVSRTKHPRSFLDFPYKSNPAKESWFNWYMTPIIVDDRVVALVSMSLDVTDRHMAEKALKESEERFRAIADASPVYIAATRISDGIIVFINRAYSEALGYPPERLIGTKGDDLYVDNADRGKMMELLNRQGFISNYEVKFKRADGTLFWVAASVRMVTYCAEKVIIAAAVDINERKKAEEERRRREEELRETRDYLDNLINNANAPIIVWDPQYRITRFNHAFEDLTGYTSAEMLGKNLEVLFPDESREASLKHVREATSGERLEVVEIPIKHEDGTVRLLLWNSATLYTPDSRKVIATIAQGQDITERKRVEQMKDEFIGLVSHELRTPLTVIMGSLRTAMSEGLSPGEVRELLQNAAEGADSLAAILENMLELSRHQAGRLQLRVGLVRMADAAGSVIEKFKMGAIGHRFLMDIPPDLPPVQADPTRVERILYNLLENAVKYSPEGSSIKVASHTQDDFVITEVVDHGQGISREDQGKLFELFQRLEKPSQAKGIGLGLVVCKRLVEAQGGWIRVDSEPGKGSTFTFALPKRRTT